MQPTSSARAGSGCRAGGQRFVAIPDHDRPADHRPRQQGGTGAPLPAGLPQPRRPLGRRLREVPALAAGLQRPSVGRARRAHPDRPGPGPCHRLSGRAARPGLDREAGSPPLAGGGSAAPRPDPQARRFGRRAAAPRGTDRAGETRCCRRSPSCAAAPLPAADALPLSAASPRPALRHPRRARHLVRRRGAGHGLRRGGLLPAVLPRGEPRRAGAGDGGRVGVSCPGAHRARSGPGRASPSPRSRRRYPRRSPTRHRSSSAATSAPRGSRSSATARRGTWTGAPTSASSRRGPSPA